MKNLKTQNLTELHATELTAINGGNDIFDILRDIIDLFEEVTNRPSDFGPFL